MKNTKQIINVMGLTAAMLIPFAVWSQAQGGFGKPGGGHGGPPGGGPAGGGPRGWEGRGPGGPGGPGGFRRSPKMQLGGLLRGLGEMEKAKKTPLSKTQAKQFVATIAPWRKQPKMTDTQAQALHTKLSGFLTAAQKSALENMRGPDRFGGPGGPRGEGRRGDGPGRGDGRRGDGPGGMRGPGGPGGWGDRGGRGGPGGGQPDAKRMQEMRAGMEKMQKFMQTYNPLYPSSSYKELKALPERMQERFAQRSKDLQVLLTSLAQKAR